MKNFAAMALAALTCLPAPAFAQGMAPGPKPDCVAMDAALAPAYASWKAKMELTSAAGAAGLAGATLQPGKAVEAVLHPTREVAYLAQPEKPGGSVAKGGLFALTVTDPGTYRVILSSGAWIDVLQDGKALVSTHHGQGPACTSLRKMVDFALAPGRYVIQISANADPTIGILVTRPPA
jgi:hypothetical protein